MENDLVDSDWFVQPIVIIELFDITLTSLQNCRKRSHDNHSDNDVPHKKVPSRRIMQHLNTSNYRLFRRKSKVPRVGEFFKTIFYSLKSVHCA